MTSNYNGLEIAVIGMAGRFPGARDVGELWRNLRAGVESISFFSAGELLAAGHRPEEVTDPRYVPARGVLEGADLFDAAFFGYSPREAEITDPQHRLFLECSWHALEDAGHDPSRFAGSIGVFAGSGMSSYLAELLANPRLLASVNAHQVMLANDKDHLSTRVSYKLGLEGPGVTVQTACSTSLVAVHLACQSLLNGECDMALAGAVSACLPEKGGYRHQEGMMVSPDGHCRAFDKAGEGTVSSQGVGIVVLRRLEEALADRDAVRAIIRGSAINNDGSEKVGYTAPRIEGQAKVVRAAQLMAEVDADSLGYVEAHGTGTPLGDPIEVAALSRAFRVTTERRGFCALGSVKTNLGHLDTAAGVTGLIKTVLAVEHREIPPSLNFREPNPRIDFAASPFYVNTELRDWQSADGTPRRAGVSSFGLGGTNAHVILEEAPAPAPRRDDGGRRLLVLSARTPDALETATDRLASHLEGHPDVPLADVAFTLQSGRRQMEHRRAVVAASVEQAVSALRRRSGAGVVSAAARENGRGVAFLFPGQGCQYPGMGAELYAAEPTYRRHLDTCREILRPRLGLDPLELLHPVTPASPDAAARLDRTDVAQPLLFAVEYALARLWQAWGVAPKAMIGHSVGEYVAACLAGVFTLEDALGLMVARGRLMAELPAGSMLSVPLGEAELAPVLDRRGLALAAVNAPRRSVVSGPTPAVEELAAELAEHGIECRRLHTSHAFHSPMMEPVLEPFAAELRKIPLGAPEIPFLSNKTGSWIRPEEATDPGYWAAHLRATVRFSDGVELLVAKDGAVLLEVGPGPTLSPLAKKLPGAGDDLLVAASLPRPSAPGSEEELLLRQLGRLWAAGVEIDWSGVHGDREGRRRPLPTYPFEGRSYRIGSPETTREARAAAEAREPAEAPIDSRWAAPSWRQAPLDARPGGWKTETAGRRSIVFLDEVGFASKLAARMEREGAGVVTVTAGEAFERLGEQRWTIRPGEPRDYDRLLAESMDGGDPPELLIHAWGVTESGGAEHAGERLESALERGFRSLLALAQALGRQRLTAPAGIVVLSNDVQPIAGGAVLSPEKATALGPCQVIPREYPGVDCRAVDVHLPPPGTWQEEALIEDVLAEATAGAPDKVVAYRGNCRWVRTLEPLCLEVDPDPLARLGDGAVILMTGGLGAISLSLAERFARHARVRLALLSRRALPPRDEWPARLAEARAETPGLWTSSPAEDDALAREIEAETEARITVRDLADLGDFLPRLDALCAGLAFAYLAPDASRGDRRGRRELRDALGVIPAFRPFFDYLLSLLVDDGAARLEGDEIVFLEDLAGFGPPEDLSASLRHDYPRMRGLLDLVAHCAGQYRRALSGETEAIGVLYPDGDSRLLDESQKGTAAFGFVSLYRDLVAEMLARLLESSPRRRFRILEVGAGTGRLTEAVVEKLRSHNLEYHFTDLGQAFVLRARREAAERQVDFLRFDTLDISRDPLVQGFAAESYDVVLALNVIHATPDVVASLGHLRRLLAPGGALWAIESVCSYRWLNLVWGLAEGWWCFADGKRRHQPLLPVETWHETLVESGFAEVACYPGEGQRRRRADCALLTARKPVPEETPDADPAALWIRDRIRRVRRLEDLGAEVLLCRADVAEESELAAALARVRDRFGPIQGVVHAAGVLGTGVIQRKTWQAAEAVLRPKVLGTLVLDRALGSEPLDFFILCSSASALDGNFGQVDYCGANAFLDAWAQSARLGRGRPVTSINWDRWRQEGMAVETLDGAPAERGGGHPLLGKLAYLAGGRPAPDRAVFSSRLSPKSCWALEEHRLLGRAVLPGTAYLEMARAAFEELTGAASVEIEDVFFWAPLVVDDDDEVSVSTLLEHRGDSFDFRVVSAAGAGRLQQHASGVLRALAPAGNGRPDALAAIRRLEAAAPPAPAPRSGGGIDFGPRWSLAESSYVDRHEVLGHLRLEDRFAADLRTCKLHPSLLDVATSLPAGKLVEGVHVPLSYRRVKVWKRLAQAILSHGRMKRGADAAGGTFALDVTITDASGELLVEVEEFVKRRIVSGSEQDQLEAASAKGDIGSVGAGAADGIPEALRQSLEMRGHGLSNAEAVDALCQVLARNRYAQVAILAAAPPRPSPSPRATPRRQDRPALSGRPAAGGKGAEATLRRLWSDVLGVEDVGPDDNFFELGGDSILALQIVAKAKEAGLELTPSQVFENQTVREQARALGAVPAAPRIERVDRGAPLPLSYGQQSIWFLQELEPASAAYNVSRAVKCRGRLDPEILRRAFEEVLRRQEVLRTRYPSAGGKPEQVIDPPRPFSLPRADLRLLPEKRRRDEERRLAAWEAGERVFDLRRSPMLRAVLLVLGDDQHLLLFTMHHIVSDDDSIRYLMDELTRHYVALKDGEPSTLPEPAVQYVDYAAWQRRRFDAETLEAMIEEFRREVGSDLPVLALPTDRPRPEAPAYVGRRHNFRMPPELYRELRDFCKRESATPFMALLAVYTLLLSRYARQEDVVIGADVSTRDRHETAGLIGYFINMVVLRIDLAGDPSFRELLGRARATATRGFARRELPYEKLVEALRPERGSQGGGLFQVVFNYINRNESRLPDVPGDSAGFSLERFGDGSEDMVRFDLLLRMGEEEEGISGSWDYRAELFDPPTIARMHTHFETLLRAALAAPEAHSSELEMRSEAERREESKKKSARDSLRLDKLRGMKKKLAHSA